MYSNELRVRRRRRRKRGIRKRTYGVADRPRLTVFRSLSHIYAQIIDDERGVTLCQASSGAKGTGAYGGNIAAAKAVGATLAQRAKAANIERVCFDRNGYRYHGRVKALGDAVREGGLVF